MNLRQAMYEKIQTFSFSNIDKFSTAGLVTRMTTDVTNVQQAFQMSIRICVRAPIMLVSAMVMTFMIHPRFARIFLVVIVCLAAVLALISSKANPTLRKVFHQYDELNAKVQENVNGIRVVKSIVREDHEIGQFETESEKNPQPVCKRRKAACFEFPCHAVFHVLLYPVDFMDGCKNDHCRESDGRAAYEYVYIRHQYPNQPDDGIHGFCDAYYVKGIGGADFGGTDRGAGFISMFPMQ